jgi:hypothetical protein
MASHATKAINREHFIRVVVFDNLSYLCDSGLVLVVWTHEVQTFRVSWDQV